MEEETIEETSLSVFQEYTDGAEEYIETVYSLRVPPPTPPTEEELSFWNIVGIKSTLFTLSAFGAVVFSAIRTGGYFYLVEQVLLSHYGISSTVTNILSFLAFVTALLAFEGYALADGFSKGEQLDDTKEFEIGFWSSLITIGLVGIFSGLSIVEIPENISNILTTIQRC